jgi:hypothetical protein
MSTPVAARALGAGPLCPIPAPPPRVVPAPTDLAAVPGMAQLWARTSGDPGVCMALLDGPVDLTHPSLCTAKLTQIDTLADSATDRGVACRHGTHVASILFGQPGGPVRGLAPGCRGVSIPIFATGADGQLQTCSQLDLVRAISMAVQQGAQIINISAGQFAPSGTASPLLESVVRECARHDLLLVAAAGNEGCECLHIPAALETVLAVGAMSASGEPLAFSNWGGRYQIQGILAPGEDILGARAGGGAARGSGTSYATAVVSGVAALLLSLQRKLGMTPSPQAVRAALVTTALGCDHQSISDCRRLLAGRLNISGAMSSITHEGFCTMSEALATPANDLNHNHLGPAAPLPPAAAATVRPSDLQPATACGCQTCQASAAPQLVYALGQLGYDLVNEARLDSLAQNMAAQAGGVLTERAAAFNPARMHAYLAHNPSDAAAVEWTLMLDGTPIYAIRPRGAFAAQAYEAFRTFLEDQFNTRVERVSIPGVISGKATLLHGQVVPVIVPELRGMRSWTTEALIEAVSGTAPAEDAPEDVRQVRAQRRDGVRDFLDRVYHGHRNLGMMPQDRALNFAATNAYQVDNVYVSAMREGMDLESINVTRSPICRAGSDCWDVELYFFYPQRLVQNVRKVYRFTVDVSDVVPVSVGPTRSWMTR